MNIFNLWKIQKPWIDDTWSIDLAVNLYKKGEFQTTVWKDIRGSSFLFTVVNYLWFKLIGFSFYKARMLGVVLFLLTFYIISKIISIMDINKPVLVKGTLFILLFSSQTINWIFFNGRMESLVIFLFSLQIYFIICLKIEFKKVTLFYLIISSFLLGSTYSLASIFFNFYFICFLVFHRQLNLKRFLSVYVSVILGVFAHLFFMYLVGGYSLLRKVIITTFGFSQTGTTLVNKITNMGMLPDQISNLLRLKSVVAPQAQMDLGYFCFSENNQFLMLLAILILLNKKNRLVWPFLCIIGVPIYMNFLGRFVLYYQWMVLIPLYFLIAVCAAYFRYFYFRLIFALFVFLLQAKNLVERSNNESFTRKQIDSFSEDVFSGDVVYCEYMFYHTLVTRADKVFLYPNIPSLPTKENSEIRPNKIFYNARSKQVEKIKKFVLDDNYKLEWIEPSQYKEDTIFFWALNK
jgi:hypothetical protein